MDENTLDNFLLNQKLAAGENLLWKHQFTKSKYPDENDFSPYLVPLGLLIALLLFFAVVPVPAKFARFVTPFFIMAFAVVLINVLRHSLGGYERLKLSKGKKITYLITDQRILVLEDELQGELAYSDIYDVAIAETEDGQEALVIGDLNASTGLELRSYSTLTLDFPKIPGSVSDIVEAGTELILEEIPDFDEVLAIINKQLKEKGPLCNIPNTFQEIGKKYELKCEVVLPGKDTVLRIDGTIGHQPCMMELLGLEELYIEIGISEQKPFSITPKRAKPTAPFKKKYSITSSKSVKEQLLQADIQTNLEKLHALKGGSFKLVNLKKSTSKKSSVDDSVLDLEMIENPADDEKNHSSWLTYTCDDLGPVRNYENLGELIAVSFDTAVKLAQILDVLEEEERL